MTPLLVVLLAAGPCIYWTQGPGSRAALDAAGVTRVCVPSDQAGAWQGSGLTVVPLTAPDLAAREAVPAPGVAARAGVASPTRAPWIVASGWRFARHPTATYLYEVPAGKAALAEAEAFAYGVDAVLKIDPADLKDAAGMLAFLTSLPALDLPPIADIGVVDDGSAATGEVMNLLARRNLLFQAVGAPSDRFRVNIVLGSPEYPLAEAGDPSGFAMKIRRQLTDERRTLRVFGSEVVLCRLTGDGERVRLHLLNYGAREIEGLRIRLRGAYQEGDAFVSGSGRVALADMAVADGATEFTLPRLATYAVVDLKTR